MLKKIKIYIYRKTDKITDKLKNVTGRNKFEIDKFLFLFLLPVEKINIAFFESADAYFDHMRKTPQLQ